MVKREAWLWSVEGVVDHDEYLAPPRVTDVFSRSNKPPKGAILIGIGTKDPYSEQLHLRCLGVVKGVQQIATNKDRLTVEPIRHVAPILFESIADQLAGADRTRWSQMPWPEPLGPVRLPPKIGEHVVNIIRSIDSGLAAWIDGVMRGDEPISGPAGFRMREERDAINLAISVSGLTPPNDAVLGGGISGDRTIALASVFDPSWITDIEDDLIAEDLRRFDPDGELELRSASATRFTDGEFALTIINVNRKSLENVLGIDLLYWDETKNIFTLVQYKRLTERASASSKRYEERWAYTKRSDLDKQLKLMTLGGNRSTRASDWRMTGSPFWFKFVREQNFNPGDPMVLKGMYVSAEYLSLAMKDGSLETGDRGGFEVTYANTRYIPRDFFVGLLRRGFIGTTADDSARVIEIVRDLAKSRQVVFAMKTRHDESGNQLEDVAGDDEPDEDLPF